MTEDITIEEALALDNPLFIDLRSPSEYHEATIPGAINIPFFNDQERVEVGTLYRQESPRRAREKGLEIIAPRLPELVRTMEAYSRDREVVIFCWRGGERSRGMASVLKLMKVPFHRLAGGYRAYRSYVAQQLTRLPRGQVIVVHGLTGCGKTELINRLIEHGCAAIDLEGLARHRGSIFGAVGMGEQPSQKMFDSQLLRELQRLESFPYLVVECESRRIGRLFLPEHLHRKMEEGRHILVYDTMASRVRRLVTEYASGGEERIRQLKDCLPRLEKYIGRARVRELMDLVEKRVFTEVVEYLLVNHYDNLYRYPSGPDEQYDLSISTGNMDRAVAEMVAYLKQQ